MDIAALGNVLVFIGDILIFSTLAVAYVTVREARKTTKVMDGISTTLTTASVRLQEIADSLVTTVQTLKDMEDSLVATAAVMRVNLLLAEQGRREDRLVHQLEQYERVVAAVTTINRSYRTQSVAERGSWTDEGQAMLRAAVAPLPADDLPECRALSSVTAFSGQPIHGTSDAVIEINGAVSAVRAELDELLKSRLPQG